MSLRGSKIDRILLAFQGSESRSYTELKKASSLSDMGLSKDLKSLIARNLLVKSKTGRYALTEAGKRELTRISLVYNLDKLIDLGAVVGSGDADELRGGKLVWIPETTYALVKREAGRNNTRIWRVVDASVRNELKNHKTELEDLL